MMVICGAMIVISTTAFYANRGVRHLEADLPDYAPVAAHAETHADTDTNAESESMEAPAAATPAAVL